MSSLKTAWHHIRRSPFQSTLAFVLMFFTFFIFSLYYLLSTGMSSVLSYFETKPEITIFLKDGLDKTTVEGIQQELSSFQSIREIRFISKEKALSLYQEQNKNNPLLTEMVTASILPASFEVAVSDPEVLELINLQFTDRKEVDEIIYQKDIINSLLSWTNTVRIVGSIFVLFTSTISFLVIFVVIGMKITQRKEEIRISRLLGASRFYVQKPFLLEGLYYGLLGGVASSVTIVLLAIYFAPKINSYFAPIKFIDLAPLPLLIMVSISIGSAVFLGLFSSFLGARRYIKF